MYVAAPFYALQLGDYMTISQDPPNPKAWKQYLGQASYVDDAVAPAA